MSILFFLMAFVNTIIDSLKDSLVITAAGGGTEVRRQTVALPCCSRLVVALVQQRLSARRAAQRLPIHVLAARGCGPSRPYCVASPRACLPQAPVVPPRRTLQVIPYLTVYAVLPSSVLFLVAYSWGTQRFRCGA